tara:strand:- start:401 stop:754 length:354 start_codon:yes stop_codon:yes gene_type:complete
MKITKELLKEMIAEEIAALNEEGPDTLTEKTNLKALISATVQEWENLQIAVDKLEAQIKKLPNIQVKYESDINPTGVATTSPSMAALYIRAKVYDARQQVGESLNAIFAALEKQSPK